MTISIEATVNGANTTGFTSPTWTTAAALTTLPNGRLYTVTAKGGTQPSAVDVHSASRPFSIAVTQPSVIRQPPPVNAAGRLSGIVPKNVYHISLWKGVTSVVNQPSERMEVDIVFRVPAGSDIADPDNVRAGALAALAAAQEVASGVCDTLLTGQA